MGSTPLGIQTSWLALNDGQKITQEELLATGSLYILLEEKLAIKPLEATEVISARLPSPLERQLLELTADDVVLSCTRVTLSVRTQTNGVCRDGVSRKSVLLQSTNYKRQF